MTHDDIWHQLPWFVNGRLRAEARDAVQLHLADCAHCRAEVEQQERVRAAIVREEPERASAQESFEQLWSRISAAAPPKDAPRRTARRHLVRWLAAAVVIEAIGLGTLTLTDIPTLRRAPPVYQTLSNPAPQHGAPSIRAVFVSEVTLRDLQSLLARLQLRIVDGPTEAGVYTLAVDDAHRSVEATLADLRGNMFVRFAEPIGSGLAKR